MLLNQTTAVAVRGIVWQLFDLIPNPEKALEVRKPTISRAHS